MQINSIDLLGFGFLIGIILILISFAIANLTNRPVHPIKKNVLIIGILILLIYTNAIAEISKLRVALSFFLASFLIHYILEALQDLGIIFFHMPIDQERIRKASIIIYIGSAILALLIITLGSINIISLANNIVEGIIMFGIGLWVVLKLAITKDKHQH